MKKTTGYQPGFIGEKLKVLLPKADENKDKDIAPLKSSKDGLLHYTHHSVALSKSRKLPLYAAVNIDGKLFRQVDRNKLFPGGSDNWTVDERAREFQWGNELYSSKGSDFDKGHMVKREDPQWGPDDEVATEAARSTFFFSNCAPQVGDLNRKEWRSLEDYILKKQSAVNKLRICVFTGPVLSDEDPFFSSKIKGQDVRIPTLFWKMVYFTADGKTLNRVGFLMGQKKLLLDRGIVKPPEEELETVKLFDDYEDAATYQVNVGVIEVLTGFQFSPANEPYKDSRSVKLVLKQVDIGGLESFPGTGDGLEFNLDGIVL